MRSNEVNDLLIFGRVGAIHVRLLNYSCATRSLNWKSGRTLQWSNLADSYWQSSVKTQGE